MDFWAETTEIIVSRILGASQGDSPLPVKKGNGSPPGPSNRSLKTSPAPSNGIEDIPEEDGNALHTYSPMKIVSVEENAIYQQILWKESVLVIHE